MCVQAVAWGEISGDKVRLVFMRKKSWSCNSPDLKVQSQDQDLDLPPNRCHKPVIIVIWFNVIFTWQDSLRTIYDAMVDKSVIGAQVYTCFQFERNGFFSVDPDTNGKKVCHQHFTYIIFLNQFAPCLIHWSTSDAFSFWYLAYITFVRVRSSAWEPIIFDVLPNAVFLYMPFFENKNTWWVARQ